MDSPIGVGFSQGNIVVNNETDVANHFMGFVSMNLDLLSLSPSPPSFSDLGYLVQPHVLSQNDIEGFLAK